MAKHISFPKGVSLLKVQEKASCLEAGGWPSTEGTLVIIIIIIIITARVAEGTVFSHVCLSVCVSVRALTFEEFNIFDQNFTQISIGQYTGQVCIWASLVHFQMASRS